MRKRDNTRVKLNSLTSSIMSRNPVIVLGFGLCPAVIGSATLLQALIISAMIVVTLVPVSILTSFVTRKFKFDAWIRPVIISMASAGFLSVICFGVDRINTEIGFWKSFCLFIPILAVDTLILRTASGCSGLRFTATLTRSFGAALGAVIVLCLTGLVREFLGLGSILGYKILPWDTGLTILSAPFGGFLVLGLLAACLNGLFNYLAKIRQKHAETEADLYNE